MKTHRRQSRGFTLVELMLVVGILGILATLAVGLTGDYRRRSTHNEVTREVFTGLSQARSNAIRRGLTTHTEITSARLYVYVDSGIAGTANQYDASDGLIYQYPVPPEIWPTGMVVSLDPATRTRNGNREIMTLNYQGFSVDLAGEPVAPAVKIQDNQLARTHQVDMTVAGALRVSR